MKMCNQCAKDHLAEKEGSIRSQFSSHTKKHMRDFFGPQHGSRIRYGIGSCNGVMKAMNEVLEGKVWFRAPDSGKECWREMWHLGNKTAFPGTILDGDWKKARPRNKYCLLTKKSRTPH